MSIKDFVIATVTEQPRMGNEELASLVREEFGSNTSAASSGPGEPSGWYCTVSMGSEWWRSPSTEPSLRLRWLTKKPAEAGSDSPTTSTSWFCAVTWTRRVISSRTGWLAP